MLFQAVCTLSYMTICACAWGIRAIKMPGAMQCEVLYEGMRASVLCMRGAVIFLCKHPM